MQNWIVMLLRFLVYRIWMNQDYIFDFFNFVLFSYGRQQWRFGVQKYLSELNSGLTRLLKWKTVSFNVGTVIGLKVKFLWIYPVDRNRKQFSIAVIMIPASNKLLQLSIIRELYCFRFQKWSIHSVKFDLYSTLAEIYLFSQRRATSCA